jgi:hypothetical protein
MIVFGTCWMALYASYAPDYDFSTFQIGLFPKRDHSAFWDRLAGRNMW